MAKEMYIKSAQSVVTNIVEQTLLLDMVVSDEPIIWTRITAIAVDDQPDLITIFARYGANDYIIGIAQNNPTGAAFSVVGDLMLPPEYQIGATFAVAGTGKTLQLYAFGYNAD